MSFPGRPVQRYRQGVTHQNRLDETFTTVCNTRPARVDKRVYTHVYTGNRRGIEAVPSRKKFSFCVLQNNGAPFRLTVNRKMCVVVAAQNFEFEVEEQPWGEVNSV